ncbi:helix-turn-helix domain-containing protein [Corynebacterium crudilactis]|uniref:HigA2-like helix-turn-helix domain-containing protein n=1 Tax=Corynebacterium crudilactis TaxID=1652495 RepID=A0A172QXY9_9CORY|nr:XRE family transcriptional regulator [Corynebacterium crudilactis]ANE05575.1 hypothetical protein ccrud_14450 [Corynebacterium crudilactis]
MVAPEEISKEPKVSAKDRSGNVWDFLSDTPGEAENLRLRSQLLLHINEHLDEFGWSQKVAGEKLDLTQPRVSDLVNGKISKFSLDALVNIGVKVGVHMKVYNEKGALL